MDPIIIILPIVLVAFIVAIGVPLTLTLKKLFWRPQEKISGFETRQVRANGLFKPEEVAEVFHIFEECWNEKIEKRNLKPVFDKINIFWKNEPIDLGQEYTVSGKTFSKATGLTRTKKDVDVWVYNTKRIQENGQNKIVPKDREEIKISSTALAHELIHIVLWQVEGDPDADHEGSLYTGWTKEHTDVEIETNKRLKEKGL
jgi:hypothetical protein